MTDRGIVNRHESLGRSGEDYFFGGVVFLGVISGNSTLLQIFFLSLVLIFFVYKYALRVPLVIDLSIFMAVMLLIFPLLAFVLLGFYLNFLKAFMFLCSFGVALFLAKHFLKIQEKVGVLLFILGLTFVGDIIHLSGLMGHNMEYFRPLVGQDLVMNLEREAARSILGLRYSGFFSEPSYHAAFVGSVLALLAREGVSYSKISLLVVVFYLLCPSPMMLLPLLILVTSYPSIKISLKALFIFFVLSVGSIYVYKTFLEGPVAQMIYAINSGVLLNTSIGLRLLNPFVSFFQIHSGSLFFIYDLSCIRSGRCDEALLKFPAITILVSFGVPFVIAIMLFLRKYFSLSLFRFFWVIIAASILSGGGAWVPQFSLITVFLSFIARPMRSI